MYKLGVDKIALPYSLKRILVGSGIGIPAGAAAGALAKSIKDPEAEAREYVRPALIGAGIGGIAGGLGGLGYHGWKERTPKDFGAGVGWSQALDNTSPDLIVRNGIPTHPDNTAEREAATSAVSHIARKGEHRSLHPDIEVHRKGNALLVNTTGSDLDRIGRRAPSLGLFDLRDKDLLEKVRKNIEATERDIPEELLHKHLSPYLKKVQRPWFLR